MTKKAVQIDPDAEPDNMKTWKDATETEKYDVESDEELDELLSGFPQNDVCLEIYRIKPQGGRPAFIDEMMPSEFTFGSIAREYGGGRYLAKGLYKTGKKRKMFFEIEGEPFPPKRKTAESDNIQPIRVGPVSEKSDMEIPLGKFQGEQGEFYAAMMGMMTKVMSQNQNGELQFLEKMAKYKEIFGAGGVPVKEAPIDQLVNMFTKGIETAGRVGGGSGGDDGSFWIMMARELKDPLLKLAETVQTAIAGGRGTPVQINPKQSAPTTTATADVTPTVEEGAMNALMPMIKQMLPMLVNGASKGTNVEFYADLILDQAPESAYADFLKFLQSPGCLNKLAILEPMILAQRAWWIELQNALIAGLTEELHAPTLQPEPNSDPSAESPTDSDSIS